MKTIKYCKDWSKYPTGVTQAIYTKLIKDRVWRADNKYIEDVVLTAMATPEHMIKSKMPRGLAIGGTYPVQTPEGLSLFLY